jgi:hypothetical protein
MSPVHMLGFSHMCTENRPLRSWAAVFYSLALFLGLLCWVLFVFLVLRSKSPHKLFLKEIISGTWAGRVVG